MSSQFTIPTHVIEPATKHTHTAILLHGRGDNGPDFAQELFSSRLSEGADNETLFSRFPSWRWVFPSSTLRWSTAFEEELPAWFEAHSLSNTSLREDLQMDGIKESVADITKILDEEVDRLGGSSQNIVLGGISQGAAVGFWVLFYQTRALRKLGGFVGVSSWLPFSYIIERFLPKINGQISDLRSDHTSSQSFVSSILEATKASLIHYGGDHPLLSTPVFLGHGTDDAYVDVSLGRQARDILSDIGFNVTWREYVGAEQEGHWYKEPEELGDIAQFLATTGTGQYSPT